MADEMMFNEANEAENNETNVAEQNTESTFNPAIGVAAILGLGSGIVGPILIKKVRTKLEELNIRKLEKRGYVVVKEDELYGHDEAEDEEE